jgi:GNAT superfamily N-acetyltransferase
LSELEVRRLGAGDARAVLTLLATDPPAYRRHFEADPAEIASRIDDAVADRYWGIFVGGTLAALVMLRGLDAGFSAPAFGVYVAQEQSGSGLAALGLAVAQTWCRANALPEIMLTVHPENDRARRMYEREGFVPDGARSTLGHLIYRKRLTDE